MKSLSVSERYGGARYVGHQVYYSLVGRDYEWELMPLARDQGIGALVWSPLGWGRLTGKVRRGAPPPEGSPRPAPRRARPALTRPPPSARRWTTSACSRSSTCSTTSPPRPAT